MNSTANSLPERPEQNFLARHLSHMWRWLTEPSAAINNVEHRRQARLLSALLLPLILGRVWGMLIGGFQPRLMLVSVLIVFAYSLSRTRFYSLSLLLIFIILFGFYYSNMIRNPAAAMDHFMWVLIPLLLAGLITQPRLVATLAVFIIAGILLLPLLSTEVAFSTISEALGFIGISSGMIVLASVLRYRVLSERKEAEETLAQHAKRLVQSNAELETANEELSQYAYAVSHDIKAPLRAIHNYADFLREDLQATLEGDQKEYLDSLSRAVRQGEELADDLLALSRVGERQIAIETIDLGIFLHDLIIALDLPAGVNIVLADEWPTIEVAPTLLRQIFMNLINNATKFNRSPRNIIEIGWQPAGQTHYELFVRDNGIGINPRYQEQIFRVFQRLHTSKEYEGTGIGLAIVRKAASRMHGSVRVESKPNAGSTFFVTLPEIQKEVKI